MLVHLTVRIGNICLRAELRNLRRDIGNALYSVVNIIHLPVSCKFSVNRLAGHLRAVFHDKCLNRPAVKRRLLQDAHVADSDQAHVKRSGNRRRRQGERIHIISHLLDFLFVRHAEPLLLVDNQKPEIFELDIL